MPPNFTDLHLAWVARTGAPQNLRVSTHFEENSEPVGRTENIPPPKPTQLTQWLELSQVNYCTSDHVAWLAKCQYYYYFFG